MTKPFMPRPQNFDRDVALNQAIDLFWKRGYHGSSMKQIEQALDMRPGSIYAAFGSKDRLYAEALSRYASTGAAELKQHMAGYESVVPGLKDYLRKIAQACANPSEQPTRACMIVKTLLESTNTHPALSVQAKDILGSIEHTLTQYIVRGQNNGELTGEMSADRLARLIQSQIIALRSFAERDVDPAEIEQLGEDMAGLIDAYRR